MLAHVLLVLTMRDTVSWEILYHDSSSVWIHIAFAEVCVGTRVIKLLVFNVLLLQQFTLLMLHKNSCLGNTVITVCSIS